MSQWCPTCRAEYVEGWGRCTTCDVDLVDDRPPDPEEKIFGPDDAIFIEPKAARDHDDPFIPIWEGATPRAYRLVRSLERAAIPTDLSDALDPGRARIQVPRSYYDEARSVLERAGDEPLYVPDVVGHEDELEDDPDDLSWPPLVRGVLVVVVVVVVVALILTAP